MNYQQAAALFAGYAKQFNAGAFGAPLARDLASGAAGELVVSGSDEVFAYTRRVLGRDSIRRDFVGDRHVLPAGSVVVGHIARTAEGFVPDFAGADFVFAPIEDRVVSSALRRQGRLPCFVQITASSQIVGCWGDAGAAKSYAPIDLATANRVRIDLPADLLTLAQNEARGLAGWHDDYPFYSDGSWSALSLRGFWPDDPSRGVKPSEMPKAWKAEHRADLDRRCGWTVLADRCPGMVEIIKRNRRWANIERVRLLRMTGAAGKVAHLRRHTDITDRAAGTRNGSIVRFHLPLITSPEVTMTTWNLDGDETRHHLAAGECWYLDQRKPHAVTNPTPRDRVHLVVDVASDEAVRQLILAAA